MFGFLGTIFNVVKAGVKGVSSIVKNIKAGSAAKKELATIKANTAAVTEVANNVNQAAPAVPYQQAFAAPPPVFNQEQTLPGVTVTASRPGVAAPAAPADNKKILMIGGGALALVLVLVLALKPGGKK